MNTYTASSIGLCEFGLGYASAEPTKTNIISVCNVMVRVPVRGQIKNCK